MEKKNLKWYEAPAMELVDVKLEAPLLGGSVSDPESITGGNDNPGF